jgi:RNA polymerase subunit RPABC4/transcription elongation factor Spt4
MTDHTEMKECNICGAELEPDTKYCPECGADFKTNNKYNY